MRKIDSTESEFLRSPRYCLVDEQWYFKTREGDLLGPYNSVEETVNGVDLYISLMKLDDEIRVA